LTGPLDAQPFPFWLVWHGNFSAWHGWLVAYSRAMATLPHVLQMGVTKVGRYVEYVGISQSHHVSN